MTIEFYGSKGVWEVLHNNLGLNDAINLFRKYALANPQGEFRLTTS